MKQFAEMSDVPVGIAFGHQQVLDLLAQPGHTAWLNIAYHASAPDWLELALPWRAGLLIDPDSGVLASGPIITLMDNVTGLSVLRKIGTMVTQLTVDLRVDYMRAARPGRTIIGRGECYKLTTNFAFVRGVAYDETIDDPIAHVAGTFFVVDGVRP